MLCKNQTSEKSLLQNLTLLSTLFMFGINENVFCLQAWSLSYKQLTFRGENKSLTLLQDCPRVHFGPRTSNVVATALRVKHEIKEFEFL